VKSIIVDIDGTLSNPNHRRHLVEGDDKDWEEFFDRVDEDEPNLWCECILHEFSGKDNIILVTGRPEKSKDGVNVKMKTIKWLRQHNIPYDDLIMREEGDFREDTVVKQEMLTEKLPPTEEILFAIDDRKDIAEMWRSNGITCLQCKDEVEY